MNTLNFKDIFLVLLGGVLGGYISLLTSKLDKHFNARFKAWEVLFDYYTGLFMNIYTYERLLNDTEVVTSSLLINYNDFKIIVILKKIQPLLEINVFYFLKKILSRNTIKSNSHLKKLIIKYNKIMINYKYVKDIDVEDLDNVRSLIKEIELEIDKLLNVYKKFLFK